MSTLENRYRALLRVYPAGHRRDYGREMLGVLMQDARPGQRFPSPAEIADLLRAGLAARLRTVPGSLRGAGWRDAAAVVALLGAVLLAAAPGRTLASGVLLIQRYGERMHGFGMDGGLLLDVAARTTAWLLVVVALVLGLRRVAAALGVLAVGVEAAAVAVWLPEQSFRPIWMSAVLTAAVFTAALLAVARRGRPVTAVLGRRRAALAAAGLVLAVLAARPPGLRGFAPQVLGLVTVFDLLLVGAGVLFVVALRPVAGGVRRRIGILLAAGAAVPVAQSMLHDMIGLQFARVVTPGMVAVQIVVMAGVPLVAAVGAAVALHVAERYRIGVSVTRRADGEPV